MNFVTGPLTLDTPIEPGSQYKVGSLVIGAQSCGIRVAFTCGQLVLSEEGKAPRTITVEALNKMVDDYVDRNYAIFS